MNTLSLLACVATWTGPAVEPPPGPSLGPAQEGYKEAPGMLGCQDPRWVARRDWPKVVADSGGKAFYDAFQGAHIWLKNETPPEGLNIDGTDRVVAANALAALSMSGVGAGIRQGLFFQQFRITTRALRDLQDPESGIVGSPDSPEVVLDQALALHALAEALITHPGPKLRDHVRKGADALIAMRSADGLWHVSGDAAAPVDALVSGLAAYALYTAHYTGQTIEAPVFQAIIDWSDEAQPSGTTDAERATDLAGILCARIFAHQALGSSLKGDARVQSLLEAIDPFLPEGKDGGASGGQASSNDFTLLASIALFQADNRRWNRLYQWIMAQAVADASRKEDRNSGFPAGENGRLPGGAITTTSIRLLQLESGFREPSLSCFAN